MKGNLEKYVIENRKAFNDANPPEHIWDNIVTSFDEEQQYKRRNRILAFRTIISAAAMLLLISAAALLFYQVRQANKQDYSSIDPTLANKQKSFVSQIDQKQQALSAMAHADPELYQEFSGVWQKMQSNYIQLKEEYPQSPNKEKTLEAMINNLQMQIQVLNQQLEVLNYIQKQEKKSPYEQI